MSCHYRVALGRGAARAAGSEARPAAGRRRDAAIAAPRRARARAQHDRQRQSGRGARARERRRCSIRWSTPTSLAAAIAFVAAQRRRQVAPEEGARHRGQVSECRGFLRFRARRRRPARQELSGARQDASTAVEAAVTKPFDEGIEGGGGRLRGAPEQHRIQGVAARRFSPRARRPRFRTCRSSTPPRAVKSVAVIGAGTMGGGIAMNFANVGVPVTVLETAQAALDKGLGGGQEELREHAQEGQADAQSDFDERLGLIKGTLSYDDIADADLIIEAVFEDMEVKKQVFETLDRKAKVGRDSRLQHLDARSQPDRRCHAAAAGCRGAAFLQSRERDQAARKSCAAPRPRRTCSRQA